MIIGEPVTLNFPTHDPHTGQVQDADFLPTCQVFQNNDNTPLLTPLVVKIVAQTGLYRVTFMANSTNGFQIGSNYNVDVTATVAGIQAKSRIGQFIVQAGYPLASHL